MAENNGRLKFNQELADQIEAMLSRARRSLVQVRSGRMGAGAGIIWTGDGLILTNHHVVGRGGLRVILPDGSEYPASLIARDAEVDLAALRIQAGGLSPALVADSRNLRVGQMVFALGHPWGQVGFVTAGIISALGSFQTRRGRENPYRDFPYRDVPYRDVPYIRMDAALAPGNSGGMLVNAAGGVIGINNMIIGGDQGMAVPSHVAAGFIEKVLAQEKNETVAV